MRELKPEGLTEVITADGWHTRPRIQNAILLVFYEAYFSDKPELSDEEAQQAVYNKGYLTMTDEEFEAARKSLICRNRQ